MKNIFSIITVIVCILLMSGCNDESVLSTKSAVEVSSTKLQINESVNFRFVGDAQKVSIFTGDDGHNYDSIRSGNSGFVVNKGVFNYAYRHPGIYKVVVVASSNNNNAEQLLQDTCSITINVIDTISAIKSITCPKVFYDEVSARSIGADWLICLPQKILFRGQTLPVSSKQRLGIKLASDSAKLQVNGAVFSTTATYELKNTTTVAVKPYMGETRNFNLYMLYYPEFKTFSINSVAGTLIRNEYNYDQMQLNVTLPVGTNVSSVIPVFTLIEGQRVYINGVEQTSGTSAVDFSKTVTYEIVNSLTSNPQMTATTKVNVVVSH